MKKHTVNSHFDSDPPPHTHSYRHSKTATYSTIRVENSQIQNEEG